MTRVAVTGGSGKLGRAVVTDLAAHGYDVVNLDRLPRRRAARRVRHGRPDRLRPGAEAPDRRRRAAPAGWTPSCTWRPSRRPGSAPNAATFANNMTTLQRVRGRPRGRHPERGLGLQRDRPRPAVRHPAALRPGRRGVPRPARVRRTRWSRPSRRRWPALLPVGPDAEDDRPAVLERDGTRPTTRGSRPSTPIRGCATGTSGATSTPGTARRRSAARWSTDAPASTCSSSPTPTP